MAFLKHTLATLGLLASLALAGDPKGSTLFTLKSTPATCISDGILMACGPTTAPTTTASIPAPPHDGAFQPPQIDDSTVVCDSSAAVGSTMKTIGTLLNKTCDAFATVEHDKGGPIAVTETADDGNTITFQMGWTFDGDHEGFSLPQDFCYYGFTYALRTCLNRKRPLSLGGVAAATYLYYRLSFEVSVLDLHFGKRAEPRATSSHVVRDLVTTASTSVLPPRSVTTVTTLTTYTPPRPTILVTTWMDSRSFRFPSKSVFEAIHSTRTMSEMPSPTETNLAVYQWDGKPIHCAGVKDKAGIEAGTVCCGTSGLVDHRRIGDIAYHFCNRPQQGKAMYDWSQWDAGFLLNSSRSTGQIEPLEQCVDNFVALSNTCLINGTNTTQATFTDLKGTTYSIRIDIDMYENISIIETPNYAQGCMPYAYFDDGLNPSVVKQQFCAGLVDHNLTQPWMYKELPDGSHIRASFNNMSEGTPYLSHDYFLLFCNATFDWFPIVCKPRDDRSRYEWSNLVADGKFKATWWPAPTSNASSRVASTMPMPTGVKSQTRYGSLVKKSFEDGNSAKRRSANNFVTCDITGPTASLIDLQTVTNTFCSNLSGKHLTRGEEVTATYLLSNGNARVTAHSNCDKTSFTLSECKASFGNVIADCNLDGVKGRGGTDKNDCIDYNISVLSG